LVEAPMKKKTVKNGGTGRINTKTHLVRNGPLRRRGLKVGIGSLTEKEFGTTTRRGNTIKALEKYARRLTQTGGVH